MTGDPEAVVPVRAGGLRAMRIAVLVDTVAIVVLAGLLVVAFVLNGDRASQIQRERTDATLRSCREVNARHDATLRELDAQIARLPSVQRARAEAGKGGTVALITALAPLRDCRKVVARTVPSKR